MAQKLPNYLKSHRKRLGLTQDQVAFLLGCRSGTKVSRYERFARVPPLRTAMAFAAVYHTSVETLFAGVYDGVERETEPRARRLEAKLADAKSVQMSASKVTPRVQP